MEIIQLQVWKGFQPQGAELVDKFSTFPAQRLIMHFGVGVKLDIPLQHVDGFPPAQLNAISRSLPSIYFPKHLNQPDPIPALLWLYSDLSLAPDRIPQLLIEP